MSDLDSEARPEAGVPAAGRPEPARRSGGSFTGRALILGLVLATLVLTLAVPVRAWFSQRAEIAGLRADVDAARERVAALEVEKARWEDPSFVAAEARRRLHFVLPGEVGYVTIGTTAADAAAADAGPDSPWFTSLWGALQEADDRATTAAD